MNNSETGAVAASALSLMSMSAAGLVAAAILVTIVVGLAKVALEDDNGSVHRYADSLPVRVAGRHTLAEMWARAGLLQKARFFVALFPRYLTAPVLAAGLWLDGLDTWRSQWLFGAWLVIAVGAVFSRPPLEHLDEFRDDSPSGLFWSAVRALHALSKHGPHAIVLGFALIQLCALPDGLPAIIPPLRALTCDGFGGCSDNRDWTVRFCKLLSALGGVELFVDIAVRLNQLHRPRRALGGVFAGVRLAMIVTGFGWLPRFSTLEAPCGVILSDPSVRDLRPPQTRCAGTCPGLCAWAGTCCYHGQCRLVPGRRWRVTLASVRLDAGSSLAQGPSVTACLRSAGAQARCCGLSKTVSLQYVQSPGDRWFNFDPHPRRPPATGQPLGSTPRSR